MAVCNSTNSLFQSAKLLLSLFQISIFFLLLIIIPSANPLSFNFTRFDQNSLDIHRENDSTIAGEAIELTRNQLDLPITDSVGRARYKDAVHLWDEATGKVTNFTTHFSFTINSQNQSTYGHGLAFFLASIGSVAPPNSTGGFLGLVSSIPNITVDPIVAVEFDSFRNRWDPSDDHIGININSIVSEKNVTWSSSIKDGRRANAWVSYDSSTQNLSVFLTYADNPVFNGSSSLSHNVDLRRHLPEWVVVGFSAATGESVELHKIHSWDFNSTLEIPVFNETRKKTGLVVGLVVGAGVLIAGFGLLVWFVLWKKRARDVEEDADVIDVSMDDEFEKGTGPKRFSYSELVRATNNFAEEGKLGEGGFGGVYRGFLSELTSNVAVKRVSSGSKQGIKEYVSEVKIISRLRHKNLVQLVGWCHERRELLLVYELMPNGSLDSHLFGKRDVLTWVVRYKIALGLASALLYLHEEWEQCVVHRDIKSSNVMLDSSFNAKLGDFGLARLVDHGQGSQTTVLAGTMGYMAPECMTTGKASKESDVYSFGIVALEIACGRRSVEHKAEASMVRLVEWVWELYGRGKLLEAADGRLQMDYDQQELERLMVVGLWCAHPDYTIRPPITQAIHVLNSEAPLPILPSKMPVPTYFAPPMNICMFSNLSSYDMMDSTRDRTQCSCSSCTTNSSKSTVSSITVIDSPSSSLLYSSKV